MDTTHTTHTTDTTDPAAYVRRGLVVTEVGDAPADPGELDRLGLRLLCEEEVGELIPGGTELSVRAINEQLDVYAAEHDPLATVIALRHQGVTSAAPVSIAAFAGHWTFLPGRVPPAIAPPGSDVLVLGPGAPTGPLVAIADTGLLAELPGELSPLLDNTDVTQESDREQTQSTHGVDEFGERLAGHGTFVASVVRQALPEARLIVAKVHRVDPAEITGPDGEPLPPAEAGVTDELQVFDAIVRLSNKADDEGDAVAGLNLSLGAIACPELVDPARLEAYLTDSGEAFDGLPVTADDIDPSAVTTASERATLTLVRAIAFWEQNRKPYGEPSRVYASAGNEGPDVQFAPAAFPNVVGVASVGAGGAPSCFTAPGDTQAIGENVVGVGVLGGSPQVVMWSGTSFSSPAALGRDLGGDDALVGHVTSVAHFACP